MIKHLGSTLGIALGILAVVAGLASEYRGRGTGAGDWIVSGPIILLGALVYSLPFSYWVVSILGNLLVVALIYLLTGILKAAEFNPYSVAFGIALAWLLVGGWSVFQLVGVWRSASRYRNEKYDALGARDGKLCYEYAVKGGNTTIVQLLGKELTARELALSERVLRSTGHRPAATKAQLEASYRTVFAKLMAQNREADVNLLFDPDKVKPAQYGTYCRMASMMFREIARLPSAEAGRVVGEIFRGVGTTEKK